MTNCKTNKRLLEGLRNLCSHVRKGNNHSGRTPAPPTIPSCIVDAECRQCDVRRALPPPPQPSYHCWLHAISAKNNFLHYDDVAHFWCITNRTSHSSFSYFF